MTEVIAGRRDGQSVLDLCADLGDRRIALFREHSAHVPARRSRPGKSPAVHVRVLTAREVRERDILTPLSLMISA